jgi:hypothetical protein
VGVIIRPLQSNEAVRHKTIYCHREPEWFTYAYEALVYRAGAGLNPPEIPRRFEKAEPNSQFHGIYIRNTVIRIWVTIYLQIDWNP